MRVLLLAGGKSSERHVSYNSGKAIFDALHKLGHEVIALDPADGHCLTDSSGVYQIPPSDGTAGLPVMVTRDDLSRSLAAISGQKADLVFIGLHGGDGENGTIQCLLDLAGLTYTGSGMKASAIAMDKAVTKQLLHSVGVPTPKWLILRNLRAEQFPDVVRQIGKDFDYPFIIKPNDSGSTVGLTKVETADQIVPALELSMNESRDVLVEDFISGRELTVAVLDGEAYPVVEIRPKKGLYDYEAKYTKGMSEYLAPAPIDDSLARQLRKDAARCYDVVGAAGLARVDFIYHETRGHFCLEINTSPGMTGLSLAPMSALCAGITFDQLVDRIISSAVKNK